ncbi:class I SAM-dependent methyltransferase [Candidatus Jorgensenbacteria bacterium]|nr:class I SAM-dependent methyltransferase [Candidatus Jorgensenbacteria bacterium]
MKTTEYYRLAQSENSHWWYRSVHELIMSQCQQILKGPAFPKRPGVIRLLDAGCGTGGLTEKLTALGTVVGMDISSLALSLNKADNVFLVQGSVNATPMKSHVFDMIASISVLYHKQVKEQRALQEMLRMLKKDGIAVIVLPAFDWIFGMHDRNVYTRKRYSLGETVNLMKISGFKVLQARYLFSFLFPIFFLKRISERILARNLSDLVLLPPPINTLFEWICRLEWKLGKIIRFPFGSSLMLVVQK